MASALEVVPAAVGARAHGSIAATGTGTTTPGSSSQAPTLTALPIETSGLTITTTDVGQQRQVSGRYSVRDWTHEVPWTVADPTRLVVDGSSVAWPMALGQRRQPESAQSLLLTTSTTLHRATPAVSRSTLTVSRRR